MLAAWLKVPSEFQTDTFETVVWLADTLAVVISLAESDIWPESIWKLIWDIGVPTSIQSTRDFFPGIPSLLSSTFKTIWATFSLSEILMENFSWITCLAPFTSDAVGFIKFSFNWYIWNCFSRCKSSLEQVFRKKIRCSFCSWWISV